MKPRPLKLFKEIRRAAEKQFRSTTLSDRCMVVSYAVWKALRAREIEAVLVGGDYLTNAAPPMKLVFGDPKCIELARTKQDLIPHCWIEWRGHIVDLTRTQFDRAAHRIAIVEPSDPHYKPRVRYASPEQIEIAEMHLWLLGAIDEAKELEARFVA